ncbi:hypothetical protein BKA70DRAFT_1399721 [Coprinopsis sp. MPI-PUGE-AT-0042]|nr:hypothetical protein BKA70DRAFT_1399721 [Coprinopsis sp. MPI-PUGE-AT-0042]
MKGNGDGTLLRGSFDCPRTYPNPKANDASICHTTLHHDSSTAHLLTSFSISPSFAYSIARNVTSRTSPRHGRTSLNSTSGRTFAKRRTFRPLVLEKAWMKPTPDTNTLNLSLDQMSFLVYQPQALLFLHPFARRLHTLALYAQPFLAKADWSTDDPTSQPRYTHTCLSGRPSSPRPRPAWSRANLANLTDITIWSEIALAGSKGCSSIVAIFASPRIQANLVDNEDLSALVLPAWAGYRQAFPGTSKHRSQPKTSTNAHRSSGLLMKAYVQQWLLLSSPEDWEHGGATSVAFNRPPAGSGMG